MGEQWTIYVKDRGTDDEMFGAMRVSQQHKPVEVVPASELTTAQDQLAKDQDRIEQFLAKHDEQRSELTHLREGLAQAVEHLDNDREPEAYTLLTDLQNEGP